MACERADPAYISKCSAPALEVAALLGRENPVQKPRFGGTACAV